MYMLIIIIIKYKMYYFKKFCYWFIVLFIHVNIEVYVCMYIYNNNKKYNKNI